MDGSWEILQESGVLATLGCVIPQELWHLQGMAEKNAYPVSQRKENMGEIEYLPACYKEAEPSRYVRKKDPRRA